MVVSFLSALKNKTSAIRSSGSGKGSPEQKVKRLCNIASDHGKQFSLGRHRKYAMRRVLETKPDIGITG